MDWRHDVFVVFVPSWSASTGSGVVGGKTILVLRVLTALLAGSCPRGRL